MISVLVADSNQVMRFGIRCALEEKAGFSVAAEVDDAHAFADADLDVDVVLVESTFMVGLGKAAFTRAGRTRPRPGLLAYSRLRDTPPPADMLRFGISGYLTRSCSPAELRIAIATVAHGRPYINAALARALAQDVFQPRNAVHAALSPKEMRIFKMLAVGLDAHGIAAQLGLPAETVQAIKTRLTGKLLATQSSALTRYAAARGFL